MKRLIFALSFATSVLTLQALEVTNLRTQASVNPIGIDIKQPSFSWVLESSQRGVMQTSYAIRIATDPQMADVVWESGETASDQSVDVAANFTPMARTRYYWQVIVSDNKGNTAVSEEKAYFETGLSDPDAWGASRWIKATTMPQGSAPVSAKDYELTVDFDIKSLSAGVIFAAADHSNYYMWQVNLEQNVPRFRPHKWNGGNPSCLDEKTISGVTIKTGETHTMRITVTDGTRAVTYIDDVQIDSRTGDFAYGEFGFREDYAAGNVSEEAYFDNFAVTSDGETLLSDDFSGTTCLFANGDIAGGRFHVVGPGKYAWQQDTSSFVHYDIDVDMTLVNDNAAVCFSATSDNTYLMWAVNTFGLAEPVVRRHVYKNGSLTYDDTRIGIPKADLINKKHHLRIECETPYVRTYIDNSLVDTYQDTQGILAMGDLGFRVSSTGEEREKAYFDNLRLTVYDNGKATVTLSEDFEANSNIFSSNDVVEHDGSRQLYMEATAGSAKRTMQTEQSLMPGVPLLRKAFSLKGGISKARLYSTALGVYNIYINGTRVGITDDDGNTEQDELKPGSTDFKKTVFYCTHDVTHLLLPGANAMGAELSSGWWNGAIAHGEFGDGELGFRGMLTVTYDDGTEETIATDLSWTANTNGPVRKADIYHGETYDARLESAWSTAAYDDSDWCAVTENNAFKGTITAFEGPAIKAVPSLARQPKEIHVYEGTKSNGKTFGALNEVAAYSGNTTISLKAGQTVVYDLGQNASGWVRFTANGQRGTRLRFRFSEMLNTTGDKSRGDDGPQHSLYLINLRSAEASLHYTMKGTPGGETFHPTTTYYGFRYVEVTASADVQLTDVVGETVTSQMAEKSSIHTSSEMVNQLYSNIMWGQRSNFVSVPTDCPQRDERLGWAADTQVFSMAGLYNADTRNFYAKWMRDMRDSQRSDGAYPHVAPYSWGVGYGAGAWADAGIILPWNVYLMTGDKKIIEDNWTSMEKYMTWLTSQAGEGYTYNGGTTTYGDWLSFDNTDSRYCSVCYYALDAQLMAKMAQALSTSDNDKYARKAKNYNTRFENIRNEWQARYLNTSGTLNINTQTAYLMALHYNLLTDDNAIDKTRTALKNNIRNNGNKLTTGFLGTAILNQTLSEQGLNDEAYTLLLQRDCPSWLYSIDQGATTVWERWNSYTVKDGFGDPGMNSFNHYAYGAVAEWMFRHMAGIGPDENNVGFRHIILAPNPDTRTTIPNRQERITNVTASFWSNYGHITAEWDCDGNAEMTYNVTIPSNTTATLLMPCAEGYEVYENGVIASEAEGVEHVGYADGRAIYNLGSGSYMFSTAPSLGISDIPSPTEDDRCYNILGMPLNSAADIHGSGVYIKNGRKITAHSMP